MIYRIIEQPLNRPRADLNIFKARTLEPNGAEDDFARVGWDRTVNVWHTGKALDPGTLPQMVEWPHDDLDDFGVHRDVSDRFRAYVEALEPGVHQFLPASFIRPDGQRVDRYFWQVRRVIEALDHEMSNFNGEYEITVESPSGKRVKAKERRPEFYVFRPDVIGDAHFWVERGLRAGYGMFYCSQTARDRASEALMTGIGFRGFHDMQDVF